MLVYKITNTINDKVYVGQTTQTIKKRWNGHKCDSKKRPSMLISRAIRKHGIENFTIEEIGGANNISELNYQEWLLVHKHNSLHPNGYNMMEGGGARGKATDATKKKLSIMAKKRKYTCKRVIDIETGRIWRSVKTASVEHEINVSTLKDYLAGKIHNKTNLRWELAQDIFKEKKIQKKQVINIETGEIFSSISETALKNKINRVTLNWKLLTPTKNNTPFRYLGDK